VLVLRLWKLTKLLEYGPDPATNPRLSTLIANARKAGFPKQSIEAAIARGQGKSTSGNALESVTIEAMLPNAVAAIIECQTDSKGRLLHEIRDVLKQHDATVTPTIYLFERKGRVIFEPSTTVGGDELLEQAIEAGALDVETNDDGQIVIYTAPSELNRVGQDLVKALDLKIESSDFIWDPKRDSVVNVESPDMAERLTKFICQSVCISRLSRQTNYFPAQVEEDPSVQNVYLNTM
jgi:transcriptional/translational regulatory protein YebC/TACO1